MVWHHWFQDSELILVNIFLWMLLIWQLQVLILRWIWLWLFLILSLQRRRQARLTWVSRKIVPWSIGNLCACFDWSIAINESILVHNCLLISYRHMSLITQGSIPSDIRWLWLTKIKKIIIVNRLSLHLDVVWSSGCIFVQCSINLGPLNITCVEHWEVTQEVFYNVVRATFWLWLRYVWLLLATNFTLLLGSLVWFLFMLFWVVGDTQLGWCIGESSRWLFLHNLRPNWLKQW